MIVPLPRPGRLGCGASPPLLLCETARRNRTPAKGSNPVGFTVTHVENSSRIDKNTMRSGERAAMGIGLGSITALTRPRHRTDDARLQGNCTNRHGSRYRPRTAGRATRPGLSARPECAQARLVRRRPNTLAPQCPPHGEGSRPSHRGGRWLFALAQRQVEVAGGIEGNGPRAVEGRALQRGAIRGWLSARRSRRRSRCGRSRTRHVECGDCRCRR